MNRRMFARCLALGVPGSLVMRPVHARRLKQIGLELYSVRGAMKRDPEGTLAAIRAIGYTDVELLWTFKHFDRSIAQVRATLDREGLKATSGHIAPELLRGNWAAALDDARRLGHEHLFVPSLPGETKDSLDAWRAWADTFNRAGRAAREAGLWLGFHNEPDHHRLVQGQVPLEVFAAALDPRFVRLQLDTGNLVMGGGDPLDFQRRHAALISSYHIKDVRADRKADTGLGKGIVDLRAFLASVQDVDDKTWFVEQEGAHENLDAARADWAWLSRLDF